MVGFPPLLQPALRRYLGRKGSPFYYWYGGTGAFNFEAEDPFIGDSSVSCAAAGSEWAEAGGATPTEQFMTSDVEGDTCIVEWLPGVNAGDLALTTAGAKPSAGHVRMIDSLARVYGGKAQAIAVPISDPVRKMLAEGKDLRVHAAVQIDSPGGTGDTTNQLVLSERPAVHHPIP